MHIQTPSQTVGPFFHYALSDENASVLASRNTSGEHIAIFGTVYDGDGLQVIDALVEIWQPDAQGLFNHPNDPEHTAADPYFRGYGRSDTTAEGTYLFNTIKPGARPGQHELAPYANLRIFARGMLTHAVTRVYFGDETANERDPVLLSIDAKRRSTLIAQPENSTMLPRYRFDIHLQGEGETVFFDA